MRDPLTKEERKVLAITADLWNAYCKLPQLHADETGEFNHTLHALQNIIMSRPTQKWENFVATIIA